MQHFPLPASGLDFVELARTPENFRQQPSEAHPRFTQSMSDPSLDIHTAFHFLHSSLADQLYAKGVYFCSFVTKFNETYTKYSLKYVQQSL